MMKPEDLMHYASLEEGACYDTQGPPPNGTASQYHWRFESDYSLSNIEPETDLSKWMTEEILMWTEEGQPERYSDMFSEQIQFPVVIVEPAPGGPARLWDGWHRCGATALQHLSTIPAVVGTPR